MNRRDVIAAFRLGDEVEHRLARRMLQAKISTYRDALGEIAHHYGDARRRPQISPEIRAALKREADDHAASVVRTMNRLLVNEARRRRALTPEGLADHLAAYMRERHRVRTPLIAENELATARLDAFVNFIRENTGEDPNFDFRGPPAKCPTCRLLKRTGPHPLSRVLKVGRPHIGCRHTWRPRFPARSKLPDRLRLGRGGPAGIVDRDPIVMREGGQVGAVELIEALVEAAA